MSVYRKDDNGNIKKIAGSLTQRINMHIFQTTHEFDTEKNEDNYIINESDAKPYISSIKDWTQYSINLSEPNESSNINIKLGSQTLKLINSVKNIEIGTLNGVIQCHTEKLDNNEIFLSYDYQAVTFAESERQKSKNLFIPIWWNNSNNTYTKNGITFTYNPNDYSITINGTATDRALCYLNPKSMANIGIGTYAFSGFSKKTDPTVDVYLQAFNEADNKYPAFLYSSNNGFRTLTFDIQPNFTDLYISVGAGSVVDNLVLKFQAEEGSVATDYQPYSGQITHNGDLVVEFAESERQKSKNLWGSELQKGCYLFADGTLDKSNDAYASNKTLISVKPNSTITISATSFEINNDSGFVFFKDGQYVGYSRGVVSTIVPSNANQVAFNFYKTGLGNDFSLISNIQLEYGSVATDYQPYNGQISHTGDKEIEFARNEYEKSKNLLNATTSETTFGNMTFSADTSNMYFNGSYTDADRCMFNPWALKKGTYTLNIEYISGSITRFENILFYLYKGGSWTQYSEAINLSSSNKAGSVSFTLDEDVNDARLTLYQNLTNTMTNCVFKYQIVEGTNSDFDFQPYNGEIVHEKEFHETLQKNTPAVEFAESERQKSKNLCGLIDFEQTVNGVTIRLVSSSQTIILNGTATAAFDAMQTVRNMLPYVSNMQGEDLKATAYYVSGTKSDTAIAFISTLDNDDVFGDRSGGIALPDNNSTSINFPPSKNSTYNTLMLYGANGVSFTNYAFRIQIEKGQVTDWEYPHGPISHNKELDDVAVSNNAFDLSVANANSYQSVYDLLRVNKGVGNFYFAGNDFPSFLPPCPDDVWHGTGNIDQIVVKIDTNNFTKSLSMTLQGINQNTPAYKLDAYFDGTNWRNSGWYKPRAIELIYDIGTKNTIGGTAYTSGINYGTTINNDFTPYKKVKVYAYRQQNGPFTYEINLEQKDLGQNVYSGSGICYTYQEGDNYFVYSSASISENKQQLRIIKCGYTTDFFTTPTLSTTCYIYRLEGYK